MTLLKALEKLKQEPSLFYDHVLACSHWSIQDEITRSVFENQRTTVPSCHGAGKSYTAARVALAYLLAHPDSIVITTAPTFRQVENVIWREIRGAANASAVDLGGKILNTRYELGPNWYAIGISSDKPDRLQGFHAKSGHILIIVDEAAGIKPENLHAIEGMLTSKDVHLLYLGNPTTGSGPFYESAKSPYFNKIKIPVFATPNFKINKIKTIKDLMKIESLQEAEALPLAYPQLVTPAWAWLRLQDWGEDSPMFQARVCAEFPDESDDTLIGLSLVEKALNKEFTNEERLMRSRANVLGVDVARFGGDSTSLVAMSGYEMLDLRKFNGKDLMQTAGLAVDMFNDLGFEKSMDLIVIDDTGLGGGVTDRLNELGYNVLPINFGSKSSLPEEYTNIKAEIFWGLRALFKNEEIKILDKGKLVAQTPTIRYNFTSNGRLEIVSKQKMKKDGYSSPDDTDALALACWGVKMGSGRKLDTSGGRGGTVAGNIYNKKF